MARMGHAGGGAQWGECERGFKQERRCLRRGARAIPHVNREA